MNTNYHACISYTTSKLCMNPSHCQEFDTEEEAIHYADSLTWNDVSASKFQSACVLVDKNQVDEDGDIVDSETVYSRDLTDE